MTDAHVPPCWNYLLGLDNHSKGQSRADIPFPPDTTAAHCWLAGWDAAERAEIRESHSEKIKAEMAYWTAEERSGA